MRSERDFPERRSSKGKCRPPHFLWVLTAAHFCHLVWNDLITHHEELCDQDPGRIFCNYSKLEKLSPLLNDHLAVIKSFMLQKRSKRSLKCFRGQILSETKTTGNQCWNAQETHRPHDLSIGKDDICSVKNKESSTAYSTRISKVQVLNDQISFF